MRWYDDWELYHNQTTWVGVKKEREKRWKLWNLSNEQEKCVALTLSMEWKEHKTRKKKNENDKLEDERTTKVFIVLLSFRFFSFLCSCTTLPLSPHRQRQRKNFSFHQLITPSPPLIPAKHASTCHPIAFCAEFLLLFGIRFYCIFTFMTHLFLFLFFSLPYDDDDGTEGEQGKREGEEEAAKKKDQKSGDDDERGSFSTHFHGRWCSENERWTWERWKRRHFQCGPAVNEGAVQMASILHSTT